MLGITPNDTRQRTKRQRAAVETFIHLKSKWTGHVAKMTDSRWINKISK